MSLILADTSTDPLTASALTALLAGLGLSSTAGLRAYLPLLAVGLASDAPGVNGSLLPLQGDFKALGSGPILVLLAVLVIAEFIVDKIPVIDHLSDLVHTILRPLAGAVIMAGTANSLSDTNQWVAAVVGALLALLVHGMKASTRHAVTASTVGVGNPVMSVIEDVLVLASAALLIFLPVIGFILAVLIIIAFWRLLGFIVRRVRGIFGGGTQAAATVAPAGGGGNVAPMRKRRGFDPPVKRQRQGFGALAQQPGGIAAPGQPQGQPQIQARRAAAGGGVAGLIAGAAGLAAGAAAAGARAPRGAAPGGLAGGVGVGGAPGGPGAGGVGGVGGPQQYPTPIAGTPTAPTVADPNAPPFITAGLPPQNPVMPAPGTLAPPAPTAPLPQAPYPADAPTLPGNFGMGQTARTAPMPDDEQI